MSQKKSKVNKDILVIAYVFVGLFVLMVGYFGWFITFESRRVINNPLNARVDSFSERVLRGKILSDDGSVLAETRVDGSGGETRVYPYGNKFAHVVGFSTKGKSGLENSENFYLLSSHMDFFEQVYNEFTDVKNVGDNLITTLDVNLQEIAYAALGNRNGAVIVMEPDTGKVLAMVSKPDFDPNQIDSLWPSLSDPENKGSNLVNRATQGLYPPGSTFKIVTALEYMRQNPEGYSAYDYQCSGSIVVDNNSIRCYKGAVHGTVDLRSSFAKSCNSSFGNIGVNINWDSFHSTSEALLFNKELPVPITYNKSRFQLDGTSSKWEALQTSIGQGATQVTPMHMALITSAIANGGTLMKPYFIDRVESGEGRLVEKFVPSSYKTLMSAQEAAALTDFMTAVVTEGTGSAVRSDRYQAAGKTGSAEFEAGRESHAWFTGFAPAQNPKVAVTVIIEEGGSGGKEAAPIAKKLFDAYFSR